MRFWLSLLLLGLKRSRNFLPLHIWISSLGLLLCWENTWKTVLTVECLHFPLKLYLNLSGARRFSKATAANACEAPPFIPAMSTTRTESTHSWVPPKRRSPSWCRVSVKYAGFVVHWGRGWAHGGTGGEKASGKCNLNCDKLLLAKVDWKAMATFVCVCGRVSPRKMEN